MFAAICKFHCQKNRPHDIPLPHLYFKHLDFYFNPTLITSIIHSISHPAYPSFYIKIKKPSAKCQRARIFITPQVTRHMFIG
ncbi:MAG: hypothetical protein DRH33_06080 [Candidatus Nealsonbacteria bacterium]|nr:MAG: hypothetical protein DRH33_06080 [Candidatus Nealsonbacteria bacterium]